eukprot:1935298-Amphidinium_carterae.1
MMRSRCHGHHWRHWPEGELHHQRCVMSNHWQLKPPPFESWIRDINSNAGSGMVKIGRHYNILVLTVEGHATSAPVNRQNAKQVMGL